MNYKGREPPTTCQKFGSGVAHTLISRQEVYDAMQSEGLRLRSGEVNEAQRGQVAKQGQVSICQVCKTKDYDYGPVKSKETLLK